MADTLIEGTDAYVIIDVLDRETELPIDVSVITEARFAIYQQKENILQLNTLSGGQIEIMGNPADGKLRTYIDRNSTLGLPFNRLFGELQIEVIDSNFASGKAVRSDVAVLADLVNSALA
jgi:hypothetical protein